MKIYKKTIFTIILFLICITNTYAACTQEEINEFKKIEDEYTIKYEFNKDTKDYTITFNAPLPEKYTYQFNEDIDIKNLEMTTETNFKISKVTPGEHQIEIMGITKECLGIIKTITLKLPEYNNYSEDLLCEGIEEFVLCQPTYDKDIDYDTFVSRVNTYKKSKEKKQNNKIIQNEKDNKIIEYIKDNLIQIIIVAIFIVLVIITAYIMIKSIRKSRRLD